MTKTRCDVLIHFPSVAAVPEVVLRISQMTILLQFAYPLIHIKDVLANLIDS